MEPGPPGKAPRDKTSKSQGCLWEGHGGVTGHRADPAMFPGQELGRGRRALGQRGGPWPYLSRTRCGRPAAPACRLHKEHPRKQPAGWRVTWGKRQPGRLLPLPAPHSSPLRLSIYPATATCSLQGPQPPALPSQLPPLPRPSPVLLPLPAHLNLALTPEPQERSQGLQEDQADQPQGTGQSPGSHRSAPCSHTLRGAGRDEAQAVRTGEGVWGGDRPLRGADALTIGCSCPEGRAAPAASALRPRGRGTRQGAGSVPRGGAAQEGSDTLGGGEGALSSRLGAAGRAGRIPGRVGLGWRPACPRGLCPPHPCLLGVSHPPDSARRSCPWPQGPGRRAGTGAPALSGTARHSRAHGPARSLVGDENRVRWAPGDPATPQWPHPAPLTCTPHAGLQAAGRPLLGGPRTGGASILGWGVHAPPLATPMATPTRDAAGSPSLPHCPGPSHCREGRRGWTRDSTGRGSGREERSPDGRQWGGPGGAPGTQLSQETSPRWGTWAKNSRCLLR